MGGREVMRAATRKALGPNAPLLCATRATGWLTFLQTASDDEVEAALCATAAKDKA